MSEENAKTSPADAVVNRPEPLNGYTSSWISSKDRDPEKEGYYLVSDVNGDPEVRRFKRISDDCGYFTSDHGCAERITHWMMIPELPEAG